MEITLDHGEDERDLLEEEEEEEEEKEEEERVRTKTGSRLCSRFKFSPKQKLRDFYRGVQKLFKDLVLFMRFVNVKCNRKSIY